MSRRPASASRRDRAGATGLEQRVLERFRQLDPLRPGPLLVAFSGGPDSLALAAVLSRIRPSLGRELVAVHVDHGIRPSSRADADQAARLAAALDLEFRVERLEPDALARHDGVGLEEAARRERYLALARAAEALDASLVAVGHHLDEQAETILLHLLRGSGLPGVAGMAEFVERRVPWWTASPEGERMLRIWRPLLDERRSELRSYVASLHLLAIDDESNADVGFRRNAVRHRALPCLEEVVPGAAEALVRFGHLAADDDVFLERLAGMCLAESLREEGLEMATLRRQSVSMQRRVIRRWLTSAEDPAEPTAERVEAVRRLARSGQGGKRIEVGQGRVVRSRRGLLVLEDAADASTGPPDLR